MSNQQVTTVTATRVLTDEVRASPVDRYLADLHWRLLWIALIVAIVLIAIL